MTNQGHDLANKLKELSRDVIFSQSITHLAIAYTLEEIAIKLRLFSDVVETMMAPNPPHRSSRGSGD